MKISVNNIKINYIIKGSGPPMLLLHGYPQNLSMWNKIIPLLSKDYTVVASDLRGYGKSDKPKSDHKHNTYSKRTMAKDQYLLMKRLGFKKFICIGHDRGARVAHRLALDYKQSILKLFLIDIIPTIHIYKNLNKDISESFFHWFFLSQPYPIPEKMISKNKSFYVKSMLNRLGESSKFIKKKKITDYISAFNNKTINASCEDYRAGATVDLEHHKKDKCKIICPTFVLWGKSSLVGKNFKPLKIWKEYCLNVEGNSIPGGHYLAEENELSLYNNILKYLNK